MILAGDVGGTKVHLALYSFEHGALHHVRDQKFPATNYPDLQSIVREFLKTNEDQSPQDQIDAACFGVPGPARNNVIRLTNLPWTLDSHELARDLGIEHLFLINDLEANGYGIGELSSEHIFVLSEGDASLVGNRALIAAGTGLGEAFLVWNGKNHVPMASEGGHTDFGPRTDLEIDLLRYLRADSEIYGHVSWERVCSGIALKKIYTFLRDEKKMEESPALRQRMLEEDPNAVIGELGESGGNELCAKVLDMFVSAYGAEAGNLALKVLAHGGVYVGGGIAPKILKKMQDGAFMHAFCDKGRMHDLVSRMPVRIILESRAALMGAAAYAEARAAELSGRSLRAASVHTRN